MAVDDLREIALPVQQPHRHEGQAKITGGLAVVASQDTQAAGVDRQALVQAVLGAKIGHQVGLRVEPGGNFVSRLGLGIAVVARQGAAVFLKIAAVLGGLVQRLLRHPPQEHLRVVATDPPQLGVQACKQRPHAPIPAVDKVPGQLLEAPQAGRNARLDFQDESGFGHACELLSRRISYMFKRRWPGVCPPVMGFRSETGADQGCPGRPCCQTQAASVPRPCRLSSPSRMQPSCQAALCRRRAQAIRLCSGRPRWTAYGCGLARRGSWPAAAVRFRHSTFPRGLSGPAPLPCRCH